MKSMYKVSLLVALLGLCGQVAAVGKMVGESAAEVSDAGFARLGFYFPDKVMEGSFAFKDRIDELKRDMEKRSSKLRNAHSEFQTRQENFKSRQDNTPQKEYDDMLLQLTKEQSSLQVENEFLQRHFQMRAEQLRAEFIEQDVTEVREELMKELGLDAILPADRLCSFNTNLDLTDMMVKRLNDKYRAQQQPKKFGMTTSAAKTAKK